MAKKRPTSSPVKNPLTPTVMTRIGGLRAGPSSPGDFSPDADGTATFRIWTCYGHSHRSNAEMGELRIERTRRQTGQRLVIRQTLRNSGGKVHTIRATVSCGLDLLARPVSWTLTSEFSGEHMTGRGSLQVTHAGGIEGNTWRDTVGGTTFERKLAGPLTADWCLFEAVQRMDFRARPPETFDVLEGLSVLKTAHRLDYRPKEAVTWGPEKIALHRFAQTGRGVYPYEYWLDDRHRLLLVTTGPRTYIRRPERPKAEEHTT